MLSLSANDKKSDASIYWIEIDRHNDVWLTMPACRQVGKFKTRIKGSRRYLLAERLKEGLSPVQIEGNGPGRLIWPV